MSSRLRSELNSEWNEGLFHRHASTDVSLRPNVSVLTAVSCSTVSKVLGKKDEYLPRDPGETDAVAPKRAKSKNHSLERTLVSFVKKQQGRGLEIKDEELMEKARHFARFNSDDKEGLLNTVTTNWLRKFKRENKIGTGRLMRRASETNIPDSARMSMARATAAKGRSSRITSPASAGGQMSPLSEGRSDEDMATDPVDFDFSYKQPASHSTTSLTSELRDAGPSSFSATTMSPVAPFTFSPDPNTGGFQVDQSMQMHPEQQLDFHHREKRSNTFPSLNIDYMSQSMKAEHATPRIASASITAPSSAIESPANKELKPLLPANQMHVGMDPVLSGSPTLRRQGSNPSMSVRSNVASSSNSAVQSVDSSPVSPSPEDARRAANTLLNYMNSMNTQQGTFDQGELMMVMQLTKKLQLHQHAVASVVGSRPRGGLSRIPEGDGETAASAEVLMETT